MIYIKLGDPLCGAQMCASMSALGHKRTFAPKNVTSALPPIATTKATSLKNGMSALPLIADVDLCGTAGFSFP
jgi:hypothetical protein